ncbi:(E2-independent) E3 ubiquitin-conjugating enzyme FATS [Ctenodactylus gundi]
MVMDLVKSNWFPSQRRAKVCMLHICQGLKTAEQPASRYEIHSRLFSSPKDRSAWERNESLPNAGFQDIHYSTKDHIALRNLRSDVTERNPDFTKETLASQNAKMISSIVISQLIDENKSKEHGAALPLPCAVAQPRMCPGKLASVSANRSGVNIQRAFALLPDSLGIPAPSGGGGLENALLPSTGHPDGGSRKGFASITITARRVGPRAGTLVWDTVGASLCPKCGSQNALLRGPSVLAGSAHPHPHNGTLACAELPRNGSMVRLRVPEAQARLCSGREYWVTHVDSKKTNFSPDTPPPGKDPLVFSSCVHLRVSQQCPNSVCILDKSLSVPVEQPQIASSKMHRSVLSLNLSCSSHGLTADGVDGLANGEPIRRAPKPEELQERSQHHLGPPWNPAFQESHLKENLPPGQVRLGPTRYSWGDSPPVETVDSTGAGANQITVRKGSNHHATPYASGHANQLSIHIPGWSYRAGDYTCCDLVVKLKECKKREDPAVLEDSLVPPSSPPTKGPEMLSLSTDASELQQTPVSPLTLQEALEVHKPQFISRSQERLKKLEHMVQQRKAQRKESLGRQQSLLPVRSNKRQFTVPHPLSDNLFKPKERYISEKEMQMRSRRIYNNLPEVKKKKEEQKKRVILQSNRLRAEVFKKQLLDQLLQRNAV